MLPHQITDRSERLDRRSLLLPAVIMATLVLAAWAVAGVGSATVAAAVDDPETKIRAVESNACNEVDGCPMVAPQRIGLAADPEPGSCDVRIRQQSQLLVRTVYRAGHDHDLDVRLAGSTPGAGIGFLAPESPLHVPYNPDCQAA